jgi:hypothetical protein
MTYVNIPVKNGLQKWRTLWQCSYVLPRSHQGAIKMIVDAEKGIAQARQEFKNL